MNTEQIENWEKLRAKGKRNYIFKFGVLYWGIPTAIFFSIVMHFIQPIEIWEIWYIRPILALFLFPLGGIVVGFWMWNINEKKYNKSQK